ncbi:MAG TPA: M28 family peptidase [Gemmatimonadales bacterium]|nr:M28 family peptidase [Gemmatimonadales bacterium]HRX17561.1 M28 family peptidase [Gemmatimonadales bacterium]
MPSCRLPRTVLLATLLIPTVARGQAPPAEWQPWLDSLAHAPRAERIEQDVRTLVGFGTRHTASDTVSTTRGIGAARRWIHAEFERISSACGGCLEVRYVRSLVRGTPNGRLREDTEIVSVIAIQWGTMRPREWVIMSGDIDSRVSDVRNAVEDSPGANDNASGMAGTLEAARVLSQRRFPGTIVYAGLAGEEQGLYGGEALAAQIVDSGWTVRGVLNNDMIGNIAGINGVVDSREFRIFSEATAVGLDAAALRAQRIYGGEVDGPSRQLARYVAMLTQRYLPELEPKLIYRLDRFGRGGHHRPFNDAGMPGVRIMEAHEHYDRQHQDLRTEDGREYGDVLAHVDFAYAARLTAVNVLALAGIAAAPPPPETVRLAGAVSADTRVSWTAVADPGLAGYRIHWRDTTAPQWTWSRFVPAGSDRATLAGIIIDDYLFGVSSVGVDGSESVVRFPGFTR